MSWRLLLSPAADGPTNMALDEAILHTVADGGAPPTLRFFAWAPPCLSLGYAQPVAEVDLARLHERGWGLVRRPTGGRAILHTDELTYSIIAPMTEPRVRGDIIESYRQLSRGLLRGLEILGLQAQADKEQGGEPETVVGSFQRPSPNGHPPLPVCFEVPSKYEITAQRKKLLGSAQVRKRGVVLQHGTLPLSGDIGRICEALAFAEAAERARVRARVYQRAITLETALGRVISWDTAVAAMRQGFEEALALQLTLGALSAAEQAQAQQLRADKYAAVTWNARL